MQVGDRGPAPQLDSTPAVRKGPSRDMDLRLQLGGIGRSMRRHPSASLEATVRVDLVTSMADVVVGMPAFAVATTH